MTNREDEHTNNRSSMPGETTSENPERGAFAQGPEPPMRYNPNTQPPPMRPSGGADSPQEFLSARRMITASQVMAVVSLVIGGVVLGSVAIVFAVMGYRKAVAGQRIHQGDASSEDIAWGLLKRSATLAIVMCVIALVANVVALALLYPSLLETLQTGDYSSYFGSTPSGQEADGQKYSIWG